MKFLSCRARIDWKIKMNVWSSASVVCWFLGLRSFEMAIYLCKRK